MKYGLKILMVACLSSFMLLGACSDDEKPAANNANNALADAGTKTDATVENDVPPITDVPEKTDVPVETDVPVATDVPVETDTTEPVEEWQQPTEPVAECAALGLTNTPTDFEDEGACYSNAECGANTDYRCEIIGDQLESNLRCCVPLARGTTVPGDACAAAADCASGVCINDFCTIDCTKNEDCPATLSKCSPAYGACIPGD